MKNTPLGAKTTSKTSTMVPVLTMALAVFAVGGMFAYAFLTPKTKTSTPKPVISSNPVRFTSPEVALVQGKVAVSASTNEFFDIFSGTMDFLVDNVKQATLTCSSAVAYPGCIGRCRQIITCSGSWDSEQTSNGLHTIEGISNKFTVMSQSITVANPTTPFTTPALSTPYPMVKDSVVTITSKLLDYTNVSGTMDLLIDGVHSGAAACTSTITPGCSGRCRYIATCTGSVDTTKLINGTHDLSGTSTLFNAGPQKINVSNFIIDNPIEGTTISGTSPISASGWTSNYSVPSTGTLLIDNQTSITETLSCTGKSVDGCVGRCQQVLTCVGSLNTTQLGNGRHTLRVQSGQATTPIRNISVSNIGGTSGGNPPGRFLIPEDPVTTPN